MRPASRMLITSENEFQSKVFFPIIDAAIHSITERFQALQTHSEMFSFLYDFEHYEAKQRDGSLLKACKNLETALSHNGKSDIDGDELLCELTLVSSLTKSEKIMHAIDILNAIQKRNMENAIPNVVIAFRIMLTLPVLVASGERSFSKLKIIKTYLRNSMQQKRLNELAIISIESDIANSNNFDDVIEDFATSKARKKKFL